MTPKQECEQVMNAVLPFAQQMLSTHGEFYPVGASMKPDNQITLDAAGPDGDHPQSQAVIDLLRLALHSRAAQKEIKAAAIAFDVKVIPPGSSSKTDAIAIALDHRDNYSVVVLFPYSIGPDKQVTYGQVYAQKGENKIFQ